MLNSFSIKDINLSRQVIATLKNDENGLKISSKLNREVLTFLAHQEHDPSWLQHPPPTFIYALLFETHYIQNHTGYGEINFLIDGFREKSLLTLW